MAVTLPAIFVPEYVDTGWFDNGGFNPPPSSLGPSGWFNRDLTDDIPITLNILEPVFFSDKDLFLLLSKEFAGTPYHTPRGDIQLPAGITVELTAALFNDPDTFFVPIAIRALKQSDTMLRNEVRRIR
jgi:hypothetical protein